MSLSDSSPDANLFVALRAGFPDALDSVAITTADAEPLHYRWRDLDQGSAMLANLLGSLELPEGARIAVQVEKSVEAVMLYLAVLRAGFVYLPLNPAYQSAELAHFIGDAEPSVFVCSPANFGRVSRLAFTAGTAHVFTLDDARGGTLLQRAFSHATTQTPVPCQPDDLAVLIYTSGTTGRSKGAMLSHGNLLSNARTLQAAWGWGPGGSTVSRDVLIHVLPLFHVHGLFAALHCALLSGSRMLWFARFDAGAVVDAFQEATVFMGVPTLYVRMLGEPALTAGACAHMRLFVCGSAPLLAETFDAFRARTGQVVLERYGMSETNMLTSNPCDPAEGDRRAGTVGKPLPTVEVRIADDRGAACDTGAIGAVQVRGPNVFQGYWRLPEKTREEFTADGWFRTGDLGRFDADGYLHIVGRSKDLIITGGFNVYPAEVETALNALPGVAESTVVGVPHADFGEAVVAVVVPRPGEAPPQPAALIAALKASIANFKVPKQVLIEPELPRNAMGKVQKNLVRERHRHLFVA